MATCNVDNIWDTFHYSALIFYGAYGLLCWFIPETYGKNIYFRNNWKEFQQKRRFSVSSYLIARKPNANGR